MQQYFVNKINDKFILKDEDLYHLVTVLRAKEKRKIVCIYNEERYLCEFSGNKNDYTIDIIEKQEKNTELNTHIELYQALIRNENFDLVLQKATELGAKTIVPTIFKRNVVKIEENKKESKIKRFNLIVKNASEQSHRSIIPVVLNPINVKDITLENGELGILAYENESMVSLHNIEDEILSAEKIKVVIGPEGGIEDSEVKILLERGFKSISLGKRILRSETASFNVLSILGYIYEHQ